MIIGIDNKSIDGIIYKYKKELEEKIAQAARNGKLRFAYNLVNNCELFNIFKDNAMSINLKTKRDNMYCIVICCNSISTYDNIDCALNKYDILIKPMVNKSNYKKEQKSNLEDAVQRLRDIFGINGFKKDVKINVVFTYNFINENYENKFNQLDFKVYKKGK